MTYAIARYQAGFCDFVDSKGGWVTDANQARTFSTRREANAHGQQYASPRSTAVIVTVDWPSDLIEGRDGYWNLRRSEFLKELDQ